MKIKLRKIARGDLKEYGYWKLPIHKYHAFNGPYFPKQTEEEVYTEISSIAAEIDQGNTNPMPQKKLITNIEGELLGEVNWYWKSEETNWVEIGLVIFSEQNWGKGIGYQSMILWIAEMFQSKPELIRIGLTTWSGNIGMIRLAEKLGMKKEAEYRKARIVKGEYYDSVSYGLLKEEWLNKATCRHGH